ncbi:DNA phosphorothioation-dependent restriction protein DptG [Bacillus subtilis]|uniref:DNA phosphorothioation-dependent restriction protein DptG n=1 Tax=Bacillus subtilis TaxID=1423 RepID=UPI002DC567C5|nr:DNA phosphorothioation-dependent restriction protein DptG [Bacillus subtilis]MEC0360727.1 DNA phosphorothioation-dependent restriction protein DptG [Bacillus subtilis]
MIETVNLNRESIEKEFAVKKDEEKTVRLTHAKVQSPYRIFPYSTKNNKISNFDAVLGNYSRSITNKGYTVFEKEELFRKIQTKVTTDSIEKLNVIINELFFDENNQLVLSHPSFFNHLPEGESAERKVGEFLSIIFSSEYITEGFQKAFEKQPENVLLRLIYECLPDLKPEHNKSGSYVKYMKEIVEVFEEDLLFLLKNEDLLIKSFKNLLLYYYFFYTTQVILNLDQLFKTSREQVIPVYYNLEWEKRSKTRDSFKQGWKMISSKLPNLFSHINCTIMLNHVSGLNSYPVSYSSFKRSLQELTVEQQEKLKEDIETWHNDYKSYIGDVNWEQMPPLPFLEGESPVLREVRKLQHSISYQFKVSNRSRAAEGYYEGYEELAKTYFLKKSGSLGYTLNLTQDFVIFLTRICIKDKEKLSLKELFEELQRRGIYFDRETRKQVVLLYERLNILEKKSDSGDAQYVKYIL